MTDFVKADRLAKVKVSEIVVMSEAARQRRAEGHDVINLGIGEPDLIPLIMPMMPLLPLLIIMIPITPLLPESQNYAKPLPPYMMDVVEPCADPNMFWYPAGQNTPFSMPCLPASIRGMK